MKFIKNSIKKIKSFKYTPIILSFIVGVILGSVATNLIKADPVDSDRKTRENTLTRRNVEDTYERSRERVDADLKKERISKEQAEAVKKKLEEVHKYIKDNKQTVENRKEFNKKQKEWRDWAKENKVSYSYFIGLR